MGHQDWVVTWLQEKNEHYWRSVQSTAGETARVFVCHVRKDLWLLLSLGSLNLGKGPIWTLTTKGLAHSRQGLALSSHFSCLSVCGPLLQRWGHPGSCSRLPHSTVLVIIFIFTMCDSKFTSGLLLLLLASVVKEPLSASWAGLTQVVVCGHEPCKCQRRTPISVGQVPWL